MSVHVVNMIRCDGGRLGPACEVEVLTFELINVERARLKRRGWVRRHYEHAVIELCPACAPRADALPKVAYSPGRPPKKRAIEPGRDSDLDSRGRGPR